MLKIKNRLYFWCNLQWYNVYIYVWIYSFLWKRNKWRLWLFMRSSKAYNMNWIQLSSFDTYWLMHKKFIRHLDSTDEFL